MNKKMIAALAGTVIIIGAIFLVMNLRDATEKDVAKSPRKKESNSEFAERVLNDPAATAKDLRRALNFLARKKDPRALEKAAELSSDKDLMKRTVGCSIFGIYSLEQSRPNIEICLNDESVRVREKALQSLARVKEPGRREMITDYLNRDDISVRDKSVGWAIIARIAGDQETKTEAIDKLYDMASKGDTNDTYYAAAKLYSVARTQPRVQKYFKAKAQSSKNGKLVSLAIRSLATSKDSWYRENFEKYISSKSPLIRSTAVMTIHQTCPPNHWEILQNVVSSDDNGRVIAKAATSAYILGGPSASQFIQSVLDTGKLHERDVAKVKNYLTKVQARKVDRCQQGST